MGIGMISKHSPTSWLHPLPLFSFKLIIRNIAGLECKIALNSQFLNFYGSLVFSLVVFWEVKQWCMAHLRIPESCIVWHCAKAKTWLTIPLLCIFHEVHPIINIGFMRQENFGRSVTKYCIEWINPVTNGYYMPPSKLFSVSFDEDFCIVPFPESLIKL